MSAGRCARIYSERVSSLRVATGACVLTSLAFLLAGCANEPAGDEPIATTEPTSNGHAVLEPTSVREALDRAQPGEEVRVRAALVTEDDVPFLCDGVEDPDPEQCSEPSVEVVGAPLDDLGLSERRSELAGEVDIVITINDNAATFVRRGDDS